MILRINPLVLKDLKGIREHTAEDNADNSFLFMRAKQLAEHVGKHEESKWYQEQLDIFEESIHNWEADEDKNIGDNRWNGKVYLHHIF